MSVALSGTPVLETERLVLRAPDLSGFEEFAAYFASDRALYTGGPIPRDRAWRSWGHIVGHWVLRGFGMFVLTEKASGQKIGFSGHWYPDGWPEKEIGWVIWSPAHEGQGFAREAALAVRAHAYGPLGWTTAVSYIHPDNARSIALATRLGAVLEPGAPEPEPADGTLVYRHPAPGALT